MGLTNTFVRPGTQVLSKFPPANHGLTQGQCSNIKIARVFGALSNPAPKNGPCISFIGDETSKLLIDANFNSFLAGVL